MKGRDAFFRELFERVPTAEEIQRFDRMGILMDLMPDDSMWYVIVVNEFYDDRLRSRLKEIDNVAEGAAGKALAKISEAVYLKAEELAARREKGFMWRSWGLAVGMACALCAVALNAGYMLGSGKDPFWLHPESAFERILSWFFNVPSGWIILIGSGPLLVEVFRESVEKLRWEIGKDAPLLVLKALGAAVGLLFLLFVVFAF
jgi:hypothetical protein